MCVQPLTLKIQKRQSGNVGWQNVPCGNCPECAKAKLNAWLFRLDNELGHSTSCYFTTLTYDDEHLTFGDGVPSLNKRDVQLFFKRLRKRENNNTIKYYLVGEYGTKFGRPHYHALIMNVKDPNNIALAWQNGFVYTPPLKGVSGIQYVLKYISKPRNKHNDRVNEFSLCSKNMGARYLTPEVVKWHNQSSEYCYTYFQGRKMPLPKYYKERIYNDDMRARVTKYLQLRADELPEIQLKKLKRRRSRKHSVNKLLNYLDISKLNKKFDTRLQETF